MLPRLHCDVRRCVQIDIRFFTLCSYLSGAYSRCIVLSIARLDIRHRIWKAFYCLTIGFRILSRASVKAEAIFIIKTNLLKSKGT